MTEASQSVIIIGGGVVGCITATKLARAGINVQIIETLPEVSSAPRGLAYIGPVHYVLNSLGLYKPVREEGFMIKGLCWRTLPKPDPTGKSWGDVVAIQPFCDPADDVMPPGTGLLALNQGALNKLALNAALNTGLVQIDFDTEFVSIRDNSENSVKILARNRKTGAEKQYEAAYCVGADGARSALRKALNIPYPGHTWPERLLTTNVMYNCSEIPMYPCHFFMAETGWGIATPLEKPVPGKSTLWRWTTALCPNDTRSDEELLIDANIASIFETNMPGPRPLQAEVMDRAIYRIHQRLAATMRKGRCLLVGDAAHANNPIGGLGLNNGILDADALSEALTMVLIEGKSDRVLDVYSDERRKVFQNFVDPVSTYNKLRLHTVNPETAVQDDWYFRLLARGMTPEQIQEVMMPYFETWPTDMRAKAKGL